METVPAGDWFCFDCQNKVISATSGLSLTFQLTLFLLFLQNTIDKVCIVCGKKGKLLNCDTCAKAFHPNCLDPPINKYALFNKTIVCHSLTLLLYLDNSKENGFAIYAKEKTNASLARASLLPKSLRMHQILQLQILMTLDPPILLVRRPTAKSQNAFQMEMGKKNQRRPKKNAK